MSEASSLSQMSVSDEYEDLVFRKVMAIYIANESARISSEVEKANAEGETTVNSKTINRLFSKANSKKYLNVIRRSAKKIISVAAMLVFVAAVSLTSYVIGIAGVKANVSKAFTQMDVTDYGEYIQVLPSERKDFYADDDFKNWKVSYAPTYVPEGYEEYSVYSEGKKVQYRKYGDDECYFSVSQSNSASFVANISTENAEVIKKVMIGDCEALLVVNVRKETKATLVSVDWVCGDTKLSVNGRNMPADEILRIARGMQKIK